MTFFSRTYRAWRRARILARHPVDAAVWLRICGELELLAGLTPEELQRLHDLVVLFVHGKRFYGTHELEIDDYVRVAIAAQACLLVLNMDAGGGAEVYPGFTSIVLYPGPFVARHDYRDQIGVVHERIMALEGEASRHGPVVLSWADARPDATGAAGRNVVLHEFAHKLDFLDGTSNGHPPLHSGMSTTIWSGIFTAAFEHFQGRIDHHQQPPFNPYAATSPAEFFAVMTEVFFETPHHLEQVYPEVYAQLVLYYRQDPASRTARRTAHRRSEG